jgi:hypothetical protein
MSYCSKDNWAHKKAKTTWANYQVDHPDNPIEEDLDDMLEEMTGIMNGVDYLNVDTNITTARHLPRLRRICFNGTELMEDEKQFRKQGRRDRINFIPRDYIKPSDRAWLKSIALSVNTRRPGGIFF